MLVLCDCDLEKICRGWAVVWVGCGGGAGSGGGVAGVGTGLKKKTLISSLGLGYFETFVS